MAYTVKLLTSAPDNVESDIKTYLDSASPTTIHTITSFKYGTLIRTVIVTE